MENLNFIIILLAHQHIVDFVKNLYLLTFNTEWFSKKFGWILESFCLVNMFVPVSWNTLQSSPNKGLIVKSAISLYVVCNCKRKRLQPVSSRCRIHVDRFPLSVP